MPNFSGMPPDNRLFPRSKCASEVRLAREEDRFPVSCREFRSSEMTRGGRALPQVTPLHLQKSTDSSRHERKTLRESKEMPALKERRACLSISDLFIDSEAKIATEAKERRMSR